MKGPAIDQLVYECMFPKPKTTDPQSFQGLLQRQLVPEVRLETQAYYGHLNSQEAKYPGLDYSYQPHRVRLSRYPWHRRLFRAFENLGLTRSEIAALTKWEGTRWAKERFEKEQGIIIRDTSGDGILDWVEPALRSAHVPNVHQGDDEDMEDIQEDGEGEGEENEMEDEEEEEEASDDEMASVGVDLNERLVAAAAAREAGNPGIVMDEEWEQYLKEEAENGNVPFPPMDLSPNANLPGTRPAIPITIDSPALHPRLLNAARLGQHIPDQLQNNARAMLEAHNRRLEDAPIASSSATIFAPHAATSRYSTRAYPTPATINPRLIHTPYTSTVTPPAYRINLASRNNARTARLDHHFAGEHFSRRTVPTNPGNASPVDLLAPRTSARFAPARGYPSTDS